MKKTKIVNRLRHFELIDVMSMINVNQWLFALRTSYNDFIILSMLLKFISRCVINSINERTKKSRFNDVTNYTYVWVISLRYKFISEKMTMRHTIKRWLIRWIIKDWINTRFLFWSLNVCITSRDFSNALLISRCLILSTNRELNMRTSVDTSFLLIDWKTSFSMSSLISFCLNATNWESAMCMIESSLETTTRANSEIEAKTRSTLHWTQNSEMQSLRDIFEIDRDHVVKVK
jgi:hypothetical protein